MAKKKSDLRNKLNKKDTKKNNNKSSNNKSTKKNKVLSKQKSVKKPSKAIKSAKSVNTLQKVEKKTVKKEENLSDLQVNSIKTKVEKKSKDKNKNVSKESLTKIIDFLKKKKYYALSFAFALILIIALLIILPKTESKIFFSFKQYKIGDEVTLADNSTWYVIENSDSSNSKINLLSGKILDINQDQKINDEDKIAYDSENRCIYDKKDEKNIGHFLEHNAKELLKEIPGIDEIRLLKSDEYINIRKEMEFGYDWKEGNWLASDSLNVWWLETSKYNKIYTVTKRGSYKLSEAKSKNYVRPVIKIDKSSIK